MLNLKEKLRARDKELDALKDEIFEHEKKGVDFEEQMDASKSQTTKAKEQITERDRRTA